MNHLVFCYPLGKFSKDTEYQGGGFFLTLRTIPVLTGKIRAESLRKDSEDVSALSLLCAVQRWSRSTSVSSENCGSCCQSAVYRVDLSES